MKKVRTVIIGCGGFCRATLPGIQSHTAFNIVGVADPSRDNRQEVGRMVNLGSDRQFASAAEAFEMVDADFAFVFSNVEAHAENCQTALEAGCCVSVAKPIANSLAEGLEIVELANKKKLWVSVGQTMRLGPQSQAVKQLIERGDLGTPAFGNMHIYRNRMENLSPYFVHEHWAVIHATAIHNFDLLRYLFDGDIARVCFRGIDTGWNPYDDPGVVTGWLEMHNGLVISYFHSFVSRVHLGSDHPYHHAMIQGSKGAIFWEGPWWQGDIHFHDSVKQKINTVSVEDKDYMAQTREYCQWLYESLHTDRTVFAEASDNLWSLAIVEASEVSAEQGGTVVDVLEFGQRAGLPVRNE